MNPREPNTETTQATATRPEWNFVVTAREGGQRHLRRALRSVIRLRTSGFRNVFLAQVDDVEKALGEVADLLARRPAVNAWLGKILPVERVFPTNPERFPAQLAEQAAPLLDRLQGRSFHVRVERRGHKGVINTHACEQALGDFLYTALEQRDQHPAVVFQDPDVVVAVEVIGWESGMAVITRDLRERFPFVKID